MTSIRSGPYFELSSLELAKWLESHAEESWWNVDGDPLLTGRVNFPCPTDELVSELRRIDRPLLVQARGDDKEARGQSIDSDQLQDLVTSLAQDASSTPLPGWADDRFLYMCWMDSPHEWLLVEDTVSAKQFAEDARTLGLFDE